ncbi:MAG: helix-hairpin-helix domain-containing protein [Gammaproteobacteria bacterium]|nr:helix-hairpin-helix domain-containing protein [Gammaproteobacteria bacterium]MBU1443066.1 helix-hairpin-helix domain-containing protein [Gammaproteobacteria bacterium]MBU2287375.1 helix-hairpin-helix domain-containing protein [Gammaproteobacteria bacterium]MBU2408298.1 helix-hairpin-helix domain-containing protein [Gammaproteobacteria bacterium]
MKKILAICAMLFAAASWAAVDVNKASEAELDALKGVGPALSKRILDARKSGAFKDWPDLMSRVKGVKDKSAAKLSAEGLTVGGQSFNGAAATDKTQKAEPKKTAASMSKPATVKQ